MLSFIRKGRESRLPVLHGLGDLGTAFVLFVARGGAMVAVIAGRSLTVLERVARPRHRVTRPLPGNCASRQDVARCPSVFRDSAACVA